MTQYDAETIDQIRENLANARENGFDFSEAPCEEIAADLIDCCSDFEHWTVEALTPMVAHALERS